MNPTILLMNLCIAVVAYAVPLSLSDSAERFNGLYDKEEYNSNEEDSLQAAPQNITNTTAQNLYIIRAIVYEIGILTDIGENDTSSNDTLVNEQVDLTFFNPDKNGSVINLGNIPLPVQTNISGKVYTGIAPFDLGSISNPSLNTLNSSDGFLPDTFTDNLQNLIPAELQDSLNVSSNFTLDPLNSTSGAIIPPLIQVNSPFEPLPLMLTNRSFFISS